MGEARLDIEKLGRVGLWTPPIDKNRTIRKTAAKAPFQRRCNVGTIAMETELLGIYRFGFLVGAVQEEGRPPSARQLRMSAGDPSPEFVDET